MEGFISRNREFWEGRQAKKAVEGRVFIQNLSIFIIFQFFLCSDETSLGKCGILGEKKPVLVEEAGREEEMKRRVVLLEDTEKNYRIYEELFAREGWEVKLRTDSPSRAMKAVQSGTELLVLGLVLREWNGLEVISRIRAARLPVKILVLSRLSAQDCIVRTVAEGADCFLCKPIFPAALIRAADQLVPQYTGRLLPL